MAKSQRSLRKSYGSSQGSFKAGSAASQSINAQIRSEDEAKALAAKIQAEAQARQVEQARQAQAIKDRQAQLRTADIQRQQQTGFRSPSGRATVKSPARTLTKAELAAKGRQAVPQTTRYGSAAIYSRQAPSPDQIRQTEATRTAINFGATMQDRQEQQASILFRGQLDQTFQKPAQPTEQAQPAQALILGRTEKRKQLVENIKKDVSQYYQKEKESVKQKISELKNKKEKVTLFQASDYPVKKYITEPAGKTLAKSGITIEKTSQTVGGAIEKTSPTFSPTQQVAKSYTVIKELKSKTPIKEIPSKLKETEKKVARIEGQFIEGATSQALTDIKKRPTSFALEVGLGASYSKVIKPTAEIASAAPIIYAARKESVAASVIEGAIKKRELVGKGIEYGAATIFVGSTAAQSYAQAQAAPMGEKAKAAGKPFGTAAVQTAAFTGGAIAARSTSKGNALVREAYRSELRLGATKERSLFKANEAAVKIERKLSKYEFRPESLKEYSAEGIQGLSKSRSQKLNEFLSKEKGIRLTGSSAQKSYPVDYFEKGTVYKKGKGITKAETQTGVNPIKEVKPEPIKELKPKEESQVRRLGPKTITETKGTITGQERKPKDVDVFTTFPSRFVTRAKRVAQKDIFDVHPYSEAILHPFSRRSIRIPIKGTGRTQAATGGSEQLGRKLEGISNLGELPEAGKKQTTYRLEKDLPDFIQTARGLQDQGVSRYLPSKVSPKIKKELAPEFEILENFKAPKPEAQFKVGKGNVPSEIVTTNYLSKPPKGVKRSIVNENYLKESRRSVKEKTSTSRERPSIIEKSYSKPKVIPTSIIQTSFISKSRYPSPSNIKYKSPSKPKPSASKSGSYNKSFSGSISPSNFVSVSKIPSQSKSPSPSQSYLPEFSYSLPSSVPPKGVANLFGGDVKEFGRRTTTKKKYAPSLFGVSANIKVKQQLISKSGELTGLEVRGL